MRKLLIVAELIAAFGLGNASAHGRPPSQWMKQMETATHACTYYNPGWEASNQAVTNCAPIASGGSSVGRAVCTVTKAPAHLEASCTPGIPGTLADTLIVIPTDW